MDEQILDEVTDWESAPVGRGYEGFQALADDEFSGAVTDGVAWAFALNGRIVGVFDGSIESFADADLTAHRAPDPALPLLLAMKATGGKTRARYYTNDTPLAEANETLASGGFTGYVELSENVLSGDYYVVYYGGNSMSAAYVGTSRRLLTGDEAFERAADEVGIYEVHEVPVEVVALPDPDPESTADEPAAEPGAGGGPAGADEGTESERDTADRPEGVTLDEPTDDTGSAAPGGAAPADDAAASVSSDDATPASPDDAPGASAGDRPSSSADADPTDDPTPTESTAAGEVDSAEAGDPDERGESTAGSDPSMGGEGPTSSSEGAPAEGDPEGAGPPDDVESAARTEGRSSERSPVGTPPADDRGSEKSTSTSANGAASDDGAGRPSDPADGESGATFGGAERARGSTDDDVFSEEARWREARAIPALDPTDTEDTKAASQGAKRKPRTTRDRATREGRARSEAGERTPERQGGQSTGRARERMEALAAERDELRKERDDLREERDDLQQERDALETRAASLETERDEVRAERDRLATRVETLEARIEDLEEEANAASLGLDDANEATGEELTPEEALHGTNLFVRYENKGAATLEAAHAGEADADAVNDNLRLEYHTTFEADDVAVDGRGFDEFLTASIEYGFVNWLVRELIYEVRDTDNRVALDGLYDALPRIDRVELRGTVAVEDEEDDDGTEREFDVVLRDGMGDPLFVANLNDSRHAATEGMIRTLVSGGRDIARVEDSFGAAFLVTSSFFDPDALEAASEETGGGLLSRSKRKSFVKLSRKQGFHLCLVEARNDEFYVSYPDL